VIPLASFLAGSILSLVLPVAVIIAILVWYSIVWRRGSQQRVEHIEKLVQTPGEGPSSGSRPAR
jgi:hypothetical protein